MRFGVTVTVYRLGIKKIKETDNNYVFLNSRNSIRIHATYLIKLSAITHIKKGREHSERELVVKTTKEAGNL